VLSAGRFGRGDLPVEAVTARGRELLDCAAINKDTAFTDDERAAFGLRGLLPWRTMSIEEQVALELEHLRRKGDELEQYIGLAALQNRNETLFYRLLVEHLEELAPIIYTPTVGRACREYSHVVRRTRGVWITPDDIDRMPEMLRNTGQPGVRLIVVTDNERILGLGDQGAGGMGIPIGKLALYVAGAGIHPQLTLPISLDCGTDNEELLHDPLYQGYPKRRLRGEAYEAFIEAFVSAVKLVFPHAVLQWEDFKQHNAIRQLDHYRHRLPCFNDDIQGTASVVCAGILAALKHRGEKLSAQRLVLLGSGAAGIGIARLVQAIIRVEGATEDESRHAVTMLDSKGLLFEGRDGVQDDKRPFALTSDELKSLGLEPSGSYALETVVRHVAPTILIGTSGKPGVFSETAIREMAARTPNPIVLPLSNPTANSEATPSDVLAWSDGRAVVATGSPFDPVELSGHTHVIGQANNVFVFPGVGLGAVAGRAWEVTDRMFLVAATTLADMVPPERLEEGAIYPRLTDLRSISRAIAIAVAKEGRDGGVAPQATDAELEAAVDAFIWAPEYERLEPAPEKPATID
jgi:malic enzyme